MALAIMKDAQGLYNEVGEPLGSGRKRSRYQKPAWTSEQLGNSLPSACNPVRLPFCRDCGRSALMGESQYVPCTIPVPKMVGPTPMGQRRPPLRSLA